MASTFYDNTAVNTSTIEKLVAKTVDVVINSSPITLRLLGNQKTWMGAKMKFPVKWQKGVAGLAFNGLQKFSTSRSNSFINMEFDPTGYEINVVLPQIEVDVNESAKVIDMVARELQSRQEDMIDDIATLLYTVHSAADENFLSLIDACDNEHKSLVVDKFGYKLEQLVRFLVGGVKFISPENLRNRVNQLESSLKLT